MEAGIDPAPFLSRGSLHLVLMPTEQCNFRCVYCYEDFILGKMEPEVVSGVKALIERRLPELDLLSLSWFGGEPLLAWSIVVDVQSFVCRLAARNRRLRVEGAITTNGSRLTKERFGRLLDLQVRRFQISLDGPPEFHDRTRVRVGGGASFDAIWKNLCSATEVVGDFEVVIRLHLTKENLRAAEEFLRDLAEVFAGDHRFVLSLRPIRHEGGPNDSMVPVLDAAAYERELLALKDRAQELGLAVHGGAFARRDALQGCYAAAANSYVVRSNGDLAKCTVAFQDPRNRVGSLRPDGGVDLDSEKMLWWMRGVLTGDGDAARCPLRGGTGNGALVDHGLVTIGGRP